MPVTVIDDGHGGRDPGALGKTTQEKNNNLTLGLKVGNILSQQGVTVQYTRTDDKDFCSGGYDENTDLQNRIAIAKQYNPDVFVSLHNNSFNQSAQGIETHCFKLDGTDEQLADSIQNSMASSLPFVDRGIKVSPSFYVLRKFDHTNTSACLVEYGFIDSEETRILANMDIASISIAKGILAFLGIAYHEPQPIQPIVPIVEPYSRPELSSNITLLNSGIGWIETLQNRVIIHYDFQTYISIEDGTIYAYAKGKDAVKII